jgi:hypothetical protein
MKTKLRPDFIQRCSTMTVAELLEYARRLELDACYARHWANQLRAVKGQRQKLPTLPPSRAALN